MDLDFKYSLDLIFFLDLVPLITVKENGAGCTQEVSQLVHVRITTFLLPPGSSFGSGENMAKHKTSCK